MIKGKTPEEIRKTFNIKNDFTEEEEAQVLKPTRCYLGKRKEIILFARCEAWKAHLLLVLCTGTQGEPVV